VSYYDAVSSMNTLSLTACYLVMGRKFVGAAGHEVLQGSATNHPVSTPCSSLELTGLKLCVQTNSSFT
jgi:hypothetical protein